jgi:hypothetical protein
MFWSAGFSLLGAGSFSCSLDDLSGDLGINLLHFLFKKYENMNFFNFLSYKSLDSEIQNGMRIRTDLKCWLRINALDLDISTRI